MSLRIGIAGKTAVLAFMLVSVSATVIGLFSFYGFREILTEQVILMQDDAVKIEAALIEKKIEEILEDMHMQFITNEHVDLNKIDLDTVAGNNNHIVLFDAKPHSPVLAQIDQIRDTIIILIV